MNTCQRCGQQQCKYMQAMQDFANAPFAAKRIAELEADNARMHSVVETAKKWLKAYDDHPMAFLKACTELTEALAAMEVEK